MSHLTSAVCVEHSNTYHETVEGNFLLLCESIFHECETSCTVSRFTCVTSTPGGWRRDCQLHTQNQRVLLELELTQNQNTDL